MEVVFGLIAILIALLFFVIIFIYPIIMIIRVAITPNVSGKIFWLLIMLFFWLIPSLVYGVFFDTDRKWRIISMIASFFAILFTGALLYGISFSFNEATKSYNEIEQNLRAQKYKGDREALNNFYSDVNALSAETASLGWSDINTLRINFAFVSEFYDLYNDDNYLSNQDYESWNALYQSREKLDPERM